MRRVTLWLSIALIFFIPCENVISIGSLGTVGKATGLLVAAFWVLTVLATGRFRKPHLFHVALGLFLLWNAVSIFWSVDVDRTVERMVTYLQLACLVYLLWDLYTSPEALTAAMQAYVLGAYVAIGSTVADYLATVASDATRFAATGFNENDLGLTLALGIPVAWYLATSEYKSRIPRMLRIVNYAYIPAATLCIELTASRGSLVAALPAFLFVFASLTRLKPYLRVLLFAALVGSLFALQPYVPQASLQRLGTTGTSIATGDLTGREEIWREGLASFSEHPLTGIGSGAFRAITQSGKGAHNIFVSVLTEVGLIGLVLFAIMLAICVHQALRQPKWTSLLWLAVLLVWTLGVLVHGWEERKQTWLFLSLVVVSAGLWVRSDESATQAARQSPTPQIAARARSIW
jgi:O-antigen ligase